MESNPTGVTVENVVTEIREARHRLLHEIQQVIIGQRLCRQILAPLFAQGHLLLIGAPGLGKALVRTLANALDLASRRIQFTPDLMPADITGTEIIEEDVQTGRRSFRFNQGPIFTNVLLADEINRTPPKTQAALLEAMQERRVTAAGETRPLPNPSSHLKTYELEGTPPRAQLDRFMFAINIDYPSATEEVHYLSKPPAVTIRKSLVMNAATIVHFQNMVRQLPVSQHVATYAATLIRASRPEAPEAPPYIRQLVRWGAGPRGGQCLLMAAKAYALLEGRHTISCADIRRFALPVYGTVSSSFVAVSDNTTTDSIIDKLLNDIPEPKY